MKKITVGLIVGGFLLFLIAGILYGVRKFYKPTKVKPADWHTPTRVNIEPNVNIIQPNPKNPVKFNIPDDYRIAHQRKDQETYNAWGARERAFYPPPRKGGKIKRKRKRKKNLI